MNKVKFFKFLNIFTNILFVFIMAFLIIYLIYGIKAKKENQVPTLFGQSFVKILSPSMENDGFKVGDIAVINKVNISEIKEGDIIAFYYCGLETKEEDFANPGEALDFETGSMVDSIEDKEIWFHKVAEVKVDSEGQTWYVTYGTSNNTNDDKMVRGDYVIGKYTESWLADCFNFISSTTGVIVVIILPSAILLMMLAWNIIQTSDSLIIQKRRKAAEDLKLSSEVDEGNTKDEDITETQKDKVLESIEDNDKTKKEKKIQKKIKL